MNDSITAFWRQYLESLPPGHPDLNRAIPPAWQFGDSATLADELGELVYAGTKTATCSALWEYEFDGDLIPEAGGYSIVLDGRNCPLCLIVTTEVVVRRYEEVDSEFAAAEGEGDRSLEGWRAGHWRFFGRSLQRVGQVPSLSMPLVCERFRVLYRVAR